jgi:hypothetical protein
MYHPFTKGYASIESSFFSQLPPNKFDARHVFENIGVDRFEYESDTDMDVVYTDLFKEWVD